MRRTEPIDGVSLVAGLALVALGSLLLVSTTGAATFTVAVLAPAASATLGAILLAVGLQSRRRADGRPDEAAGLHRNPSGRWLGGVCSGVAQTLGIEPAIVRIGFVLAALAGGLGIVLYALGWVLLPARRSDGAAPPPARGILAVAFGVSLLALAGLLAVRAAGVWIGDGFVWPAALVAGGAALLWRRSRTEPAVDTPAVPQPPKETRGETFSRTGVGVALVLAAALLFLQSTGAFGAARDALLAVVVAAVVLGVIFAPTIVRLIRSRDTERAERIRSQERAEMGAHLHDSVLQTLALLQQRADDPRAVTQLARRQERELRRWLSGRAPLDGAPQTLAAALEATADDVERDHRVDVELVIVGDTDLTPRTEALLGAAREALVNAARHGGGGPVDVYAEAQGGRVEVDVRDRGPGFDPATIPADRHGVRESIVGRMARHGGRATIGPAPGGGTEVELVLDPEGDA